MQRVVIQNKNLIKIFLIAVLFKVLFPVSFASDHRSIDEEKPKINPKELIEKLTVLIEGKGEPGSGVIVKKKDNVYSVLTAAHVVCNSRDQSVDTEEYAVKTFDDFWHDSSTNSNLKVICPPVLKISKKISSGIGEFCTPPMRKAYPWPIDIAILEFKSDNKYMFAKRTSSVKRLGKDVYVAGYPVSSDGKLVISESQGTVDIPPSSINETCKGYGLRYVAPTEIGMSGGGVWSKKGKLVGIHGYREVSRGDNIVLSQGSFSVGIHLPFWKQMIDPFDPSKGFPENNNNNDDDDVSALISRTRSYINIARTGDTNFRRVESIQIIESLKKAEKLDPRQPIIPTLIAQVYIRKFEDGDKKQQYLEEALININRAIRLYNPVWLSETRNYDGSYEKIRAYIHFLRGQFLNNEKSILSYRIAIKEINKRLSAKPDDVDSWKDKAKYHFHAKEIGEAYSSLINASKLAPKDPSVFIDMGIVLANNNEYGRACKDFYRATALIEEGFSRQGEQGAFAKDYQQQKLRIKPWTDFLGC